jgi:hypothetical protein
MPRCQRTFQRLGEASVSAERHGGARWVCPYCPEAETYETITEADLLSYVTLAEAACIQDFGPPQDRARPTVLLFGLRPECVLETVDRRYDLYVQHGSDPFQLRLQIGHEVFHRVCSRGRIFHWTHEMLACMVSVRLLHRYGMQDYAGGAARRYADEAAALPVNAMLGLDLWSSPSHPPGFYGRAYTTGVALEQAVGWPALCRLARTLDKNGNPDVPTWFSSLSENEKTNCLRILGITTVT